MQIDSTPSWGTRVRVDLPLGAARDEIEPAPRIRVVVVHEQPLVRAGLVRLLGRAEPGIRVVGDVELTEVAIRVF